MRRDPRPTSPEVIAVKVPRDLARAIRQRAREDDRTVSGFLRRHLAAMFQATTEKGHG